MARFGPEWRDWTPPAVKGGTPAGAPVEKESSRWGEKRCVVTARRELIDAATAKQHRIYGDFFHSKAEAKHWLELLRRQDIGEISELRRQVAFPLHTRNPQGLVVVVARWIADYVFQENGQLVVSDKKARGGIRDRVYLLKKKWFEAEYGIQIREV